MGRLSGEQLTTFRHLADATAAFVSGRRFLDVAGYVAANQAFHQFLIEATRNAQLIALYAQLTVRDYIDCALTASVEIVGDIVQQHRDLVSAFEYGDLNAARDVLAQHAHHSRTTMSRALALKTAPVVVTPPVPEPEAPRCPFHDLQPSLPPYSHELACPVRSCFMLRRDFFDIVMRTRNHAGSDHFTDAFCRFHAGIHRRRQAR